MKLLREGNMVIGGEGGFPVYRIPGIIATDRGTLLAYFECRRDDGDWAVSEIGMKRSVDGGKTWSSIQLIGYGRNKNTSNNPVMFADGERIHFLYFENYKRAFYRCSDDEGKTWTDEVEITDSFETIRSVYNWSVIAAGPGHGKCLKNGRLIVPIWLASNMSNIFAHSPSVTASLYSDDHGKTWHIGEILPIDFAPNPNETSMVELHDGTVIFNVRNTSEKKQRIFAKSKTGSDGWYDIRFVPELPDPICMSGMCEIPDGYLFTNCNSQNTRVNLTLRKSTSECNRWEEELMYSEIGGYSDVCYNPKTGTAFLLYEHNITRLQYCEVEL